MLQCSFHFHLLKLALGDKNLLHLFICKLPDSTWTIVLDLLLFDISVFLLSWLLWSFILNFRSWELIKIFNLWFIALESFIVSVSIQGTHLVQIFQYWRTLIMWPPLSWWMPSLTAVSLQVIGYLFLISPSIFFISCYHSHLFHYWSQKLALPVHHLSCIWW